MKADRNERCSIICTECSPIATVPTHSDFSLYPFNLFIMTAARSQGRSCFILIAYFRLKKLVFLDYIDVEMGAGELFTFIRQYVFPPRSFVLTAEFLFIYWQWN